MSNPYVGEIRLVAFNFAPDDWALCNGQLLDISENSTLFQLIGNTYGGDGVTTFALPDLQGRVPMHVGNGYTFGLSAGSDSVTLNVNQIPSHSHVVHGTSDAAKTTDPAQAVPAGGGSYTTAEGNVHMKTVGDTGGGEAISLVQPVLTLNFVISLFGIFPSQS